MAGVAEEEKQGARKLETHGVVDLGVIDEAPSAPKHAASSLNGRSQLLRSGRH